MMKTMRALRGLCLFASGALLLGACASQPRVVVVHEPNPEQPPTHIPLQSEANVEVPGTIKAYPVARYIDPSNPRIMHERHVIYRREEDEHWRLAANARRQILIGNTLSDSRQERRAAPYAQELPYLLRKSQRQARDLNRALEAQTQQGEAVAGSIQNLGQGIQSLNRRVDDLERRLNQPRPGASPAPSVPPARAPAAPPTPSVSPLPDVLPPATPNGSSAPAQ
jgi:hypothetical protein